MCGTASSLTAKFNIGAVPAFRLKQAFTRCPTNRQPVAHRNGIIQQRTTTIVRQSLPVPPRITCRQIWACLGSHRQAVGDIGCDRKCLAAGGGQLLRQCLNAILTARAQHHGCTLCREDFGRGLTKATACTCYDDNFAFDVMTHLFTIFRDGFSAIDHGCQERGIAFPFHVDL